MQLKDLRILLTLLAWPFEESESEKPVCQLYCLGYIPKRHSAQFITDFATGFEITRAGMILYHYNK